MKPIGEYSPLTPWRTAGSGSARWCYAERGGCEYFVKQFLRPVYPSAGGALFDKQLARCREFEARKQRLYAALSCVIGDTLVPVLDFFRCERHYYAVSEAVPEPRETGEDVSDLRLRAKRELLRELAICLQRLHLQGVVHADLKPEHVLVRREPEGCRARLIDVDSGFLCDDPPPRENDLEGDPVYLAPEMFLRMTGRDAPIDVQLDAFAFGAMLHRMFTGELPGFDRARYGYLCEAALDGAPIELSPHMPIAYRLMVRAMLDREPRNRPNDAEIVRTLSAPYRGEQRGKSDDAPLNGLSRYMRG